MLLHALPSFVTLAAASDTKPPTAPVPSALELGLLEQLDLVVCPGPYLPRLLCGAGARVPYVICPPGTVKRSPRVRPKALEGPLRLLSVGNLTRGKGFRDGLLALSRLQDLDWEWELVGSRDWDAEFACELDELANSLGLTKRVHFLGQLEHHQTLERYQNNQLFLLPSYSENYPLVLLEAQAHSLPVVAYDVAGVPDIVQHDVSGLLAAPFDTDALGRCLEQLLKSRALRQRHGAAAHAAASERPEWREASELFERRLLDLPGPAAPAT
jgi:glycosyltransferase involved in cell wall biosynthesis